MPTYHNPEDAGNPLTRLLLKAVPENEHGNKTIAHLAKLLPCTRATVFNWITDQKLPPHRATQIVDVSKITGYDKKGKPILGEPRVSLDDLHQFVYAP